jgi:hypothetical protein
MVTVVPPPAGPLFGETAVTVGVGYAMLVEAVAAGNEYINKTANSQRRSEKRSAFRHPEKRNAPLCRCRITRLRGSSDLRHGLVIAVICIALLPMTVFDEVR